MSQGRPFGGDQNFSLKGISMKVIFKKFIANKNNPPGTKIRVFGHDTIVRPNGTLMCDMDPEMAEIEIRAGRVVPAEERRIIKSTQVQNDLFDPELLKKYDVERDNVFGFGTVSDLKANLKQEKMDVLRWFAKNKLYMDLGSTSRSKMFSEIASALDNIFSGKTDNP